MFALTFKSQVVQIEAAQFPVHSSLLWVDIGANSQGVAVGWSYDGTVFAAPIQPVLPPPPTASERARAEIAQSKAFAGLAALLAEKAAVQFGATAQAVIDAIAAKAP